MRLCLSFIALSLYAQTPEAAIDRLILRAPAPAGPSSVTIRYTGTAGPFPSPYYWVIAEYASGHSAPVGPLRYYGVPASFNASNYITLSWLPVTGAIQYRIVRSNYSTFPGGGATLAGTTSSTSWSDTGATLTSWTYTPIPPQTLTVYADASRITAGAAVVATKPIVADIVDAGGQSGIINVLSLGARCDGVSDDSAVLSSTPMGSVLYIPTGRTCVASGNWLTDRKFVGPGKIVDASGYVRIPNRVVLTQRPNQGKVWKRSDNSLVSVVVSSGTATATFSSAHGLLAGGNIQVAGFYTDSRLNTDMGSATISSVTTNTISWTTTAANGTYTDETGEILDVSNFPAQADTRYVDARYMEQQSSVSRGGIDDRYFAPEIYPMSLTHYTSSGYSGVSAVTTAAAAAGSATLSVNDTSAFYIGQIVRLEGEDTSGTTHVEYKKVQSKTTNSLTFTNNTSYYFNTNTRIGTGIRTMNAGLYMIGKHYAGGDYNNLFLSAESHKAPDSGQTHSFYNSTAQAIGGSLDAWAAHTALGATEFSFYDHGYDTNVGGHVLNLNRTNNTASMGEQWIGSFYQTGSVAIDAAVSMKGHFLAGVDTSLADTTTDALRMKNGQAIKFDCSYSGTSPAFMASNTCNTAQIRMAGGNSIKVMPNANGSFIVADSTTANHFEVNTQYNLVILQDLAGTGNAYVCVNNIGALYRSSSPCQ